MIPDPAPPFDVRLLGLPRDQIVNLLSRAKPLGMWELLRQQFIEVDRALRERPHEWGDPMRNFRALKQVLYRGVMNDVIVYYAVHDRLPEVLVTWVTAPNSHPLSDD